MTGKGHSYGGVLIDDDGRILLREPTNHYDRYVWTFAKGRRKGEETEQETALREVREETGVVAEILERIEGEFEGGMGSNVYFLMRPTGAGGTPRRNETASVHWVARLDTTQDVDVAKTREMIEQTTNPVGRVRDLKVLEAAVELWRKRQQLPPSD